MKPVKWNCRAETSCRNPLGFESTLCQESSLPKLLLFLASLSKCSSVTGRYVSQSHPGLNSIKESTKTYASEASDMIRVLCTTMLPHWFIPSLIWSVTGWNEAGSLCRGCRTLERLLKASCVNLSHQQVIYGALHLTSEVGISKFTVGYIIREAPWSQNSNSDTRGTSS